MNRIVPYLLAALMVTGIGFAAGAAAGALLPSHTEVDDPEEVLAPMADDDVICTSDYSNLTSGPIRGRLGRERKDGTLGRARMTIEIQSEPLVHVFDEVQLGHGPAEAAAQVLAEKVRGISETVAPETALTRKHQEAAYARGESWAKKRFGGPRLGERPPNPSSLRKFNHSGTFADSIVARENKTDKTWTVNVAANRLDPRTSRNAAEFAFITDALRRLVPELDDPARLQNDPRVMKAIDDAVESLILNAAKLNQQLRAKLWQARLSLGGAIRLPPGVSWGVQRVVLG
jgi:hypothetical protein